MDISQKKLDEIILKARTNIEKSCLDGNKFNYGTYSGSYYMGQYYLMASWLGTLSENFDKKHYCQLLLSTQEQDGSWHQVKDANLPQGELNTTFINYWALKTMGPEVSHEALEKARNFILSQGGMANLNLFTKILLCLFGEISWSEIPSIPYLLFFNNPVIDHRNFAQWIGPHILPFSYLRRLKVSKSLGPNFSVHELKSSHLLKFKSEKSQSPIPYYDDFIVERILKEQSPLGPLGGYTHSTLFALVVLDHFRSHSKKLKEKIELFEKKAYSYIEKMYLDKSGNPYAGSTCDGHYWDSIFCAQALLDSGGNSEIIRNVAKYIASVQTPEGGIPFGIGFEKAPDVDDTVEAMLLWNGLKDFSEEMNRAKDWLMARQNDDGGWGAFGHNNNERIILKLHSKKFLNTAELFDYSSPDCTGNILEALSHFGLNQNNSLLIRNGVSFLKKTQDTNGAWCGRWAINYLFGTYVAVVGSIKAGCDPKEPFLKKALLWLMSKQNPDGGWGESTHSYIDKSWAGKGISTHSQTAWALMALIEAKLHDSDAVKRGVSFLLQEFSEKNKFEDVSVVGTGHPRNVYLQYPSYAACFPLMALCRYRNSTSST